MPHVQPLPDPLPRGPFAYGDGITRGASRSRLRASDLESPFHGVRRPASPPAGAASHSLIAQALAFLPLLAPDQYFSHYTAAALLGLRLPERRPPSKIDVTSIAPLRAVRHENVVGHQAIHAAVVSLPNGARVSSPLQTWCDLAAVLTVDDLIAMGDGLVRRKNPICTMEQLSSAVHARRGQRGYRRLLEALPQIRPGTDSFRETVLRLILVRAGFPEPEVNGEIFDSFGLVIAHGDLLYRRFKTLIEYDGEHHRLDEAQFNIDVDRLDTIVQEGWRVIRVSKDLLYRRATLLGRVETALTQGGWARPAN